MREWGVPYCHAACSSRCKAVRTKGGISAICGWELVPDVKQWALKRFAAVGTQIQVPQQSLLWSHSIKVSTPSPAE